MTVLQVAAKAAIVDNQGRVLMVREAASHATNTKAGLYGLPGGRLEPNEPFAQGLVREVQEETGLTVTLLHPLQVGEWWPVIRGTKHHVVGVFMACQSAKGRVRLSDEHDAFMWVDTHTLSTLPTMEPDASVVASFLHNAQS